MPLYQYKCTGCGNVEERLQTMDEMTKNIGSPVCCSGCDHPYERMVGGASIGLCDTNWWRSVRNTVNDFDDPTYDFKDVLEANLKKAGVSKQGKVYMPNLAMYLGDPEAMIGGIDDIKDLCKRRGWIFNGIKDGNVDVKIPADMSKDLADQTVFSKVGT